MRIESSNYLSALEALKSANSNASQTETTTSSQTGEMDAYIPSNSDDEILYANYNDILSSFLQTVQSTASTTTSSTESTTTQAVDSTIKSLVNSISESLRCNKDTVLSTLESLGLSPKDLLDSDNITTLANTLNEGAAALGLPTVEDLDQVISDLTSSVESSVSSLKSDYSLTDDELAAILESLGINATRETEATTETTSTQAVDDAIKTLINDISESLRCNEDTILSTLESLGLTPEDLLDSDNISTLANALNENAAALGLPTVEDLDQVISDLTETVENTVSSLESDYSLTDEQLTAILEQLKSRPFDETTLSDILAALAEAEESEA